MAATLRLHGYPVSNYFNIARAALLEKGLPHEIVETRATQDTAFLQRSPMGKIPVLETGGGWIAETIAIVEWLDDVYPDRLLRPVDPMIAARGRQLINILQSYVEAPARSLFPGVFAAGETETATVDRARAVLDRSTRALASLAADGPFLLGPALSQADLFAYYILDIAERVGTYLFERSILSEAGLTGWFAAMRSRPAIRLVDAAFEEAFLPYLAQHQAPYLAVITRAGAMHDA